MHPVFVLLVAIFSILIVAWVAYDAGYDKGWWDRDQGKPLI